MFLYGKTVANAIAVASYLAAEAPRRVASREIAKARGLSQVLSAKILTQLAAATLADGQPGPGGGYTLARPAKRISLMDIARLFEQTERPAPCPFGHDWCGRGEPCPLHRSFQNMIAANRHFMETTRLSLFAQTPACGRRAPRRAKAAIRKPR